jgi:hypothetical protein
MALRDVRQGRDCIQRQLKVIATLRDRGLPTDQAEAILRWLEERSDSLKITTITPCMMASGDSNYVRRAATAR